MNRFCTLCGVRNDADALHCEGCGAMLKREGGTTMPAPGMLPPARRRLATRMLVIAGGAVLTVLAVAAGAWWVLSPPAASGAAFAKVLRDSADPGSRPSPDLLCLNNLAYDRPQIVVAEHDVRARGWMDGLVNAGLYEPGQAVAANASRRLIQFTATPELQQ